MKKLLCLIVSIGILTAMLSAYIPAFASETLYSDFVTPQMPENVFQGSSTYNNFTGRWYATYEVNAPNHSGGIPGAMRFTLADNPQYANSSRYGISGGTFITRNVFGDFTFKADTNYVISAKFKNNSSVCANFGFCIDTYNSSDDVSRPYVYDTITNFGDDWFDFRKVINTGTIGTAEFNLRYGYPTRDGEKTPDGSDVLYKLGSLYIAEEIPYTLSVSADRTLVCPGDTVSVSATLLNQIGISGNLSDNMDYVVLNSDRTAEADGFEIKKNGTSGAYVTVTDAPDGDYIIYAKSDYDNVGKGVKISVTKWKDTPPADMPQNLIHEPLQEKVYIARNYGNISAFTDYTVLAGTNPSRYPVKYTATNTEVVSVNTMAGGQVQGMRVGDSISEYDLNARYSFNGKALSAGSYVVTASVMNSSSDGTDCNFGIMMLTRDNTDTESRDSHTISVPADGKWHDFKHTYTLTADGTSASNMYIGFPNGESITKDVTSVHFDKTLYVAPEIATEIKNTLVSGKVNMTYGDTAVIKSETVNQVGLKGNIEQDIEWYPVTYDRASITEWINVKSLGDGKVEITLKENTPDGLYTVVAKSSKYGMRKGFVIQVGDGAELFVSPSGNDNNPGTIDMPLASFEGAKEKIRELKNQAVAIKKVNFRGGEYILNNTVTLTDDDSGSADRKIVYSAYEGEKPIFKGTKEIAGKNARYVEDESVLERLYPHVRDKVMVIDLADSPITKEDIFNPENMHTAYSTEDGDYNALYIDDAQAMLSQWPNGRQYTRRGKSAGDYAFYYNEDCVARWVTAPDFWITSSPSWNFQYMRTYVENVDTADKIITVTSKAPYIFEDTTHDDGTEPMRKWKAYNLLEEIDLPGEYYIDRENLKLYFYPATSPADTKLELSVNTKPLLTLDGVSNLTFSGLEFAKTRHLGVYGKDIYDVDFENCTFRDIGTYAYFVEGTEKPKTGAGYWQESYLSNDASYNCDVRNCVFDNIGGSSVYMEGGNVDTLTPSGNIIENNFISASSVSFTNDGAVLIGGVGITVRDNIISKSEQHGITIYGNDHLVTENEIYAVLQNVADAGAIYQGRSFLGRGNTISRNYIHDIKSSDSTSGMDGIYMDDSQQGNTIEQNIIVNVPTGYNSNGAGDMIFKNNTVVNSDHSWNFHWTSFELHAINGNKDYRYPDVSMVGTLSDLENIIWDKDLYFTRYPNLKTMCQTKKNPKYFSVISGNLSVNEDTEPVNTICLPDSTLSAWSNNTIEIADFEEIFADPANHDYRLKADSKYALSSPGLLNENNFDMSDIGVTTDFETADSVKLLYPADTNVSSKGFDLYWEDGFGLDSYTVEVSSDKTFSTVVLRETVNTNVYTVPSGSLQGESTYYWRVIAKNGSKDIGTTVVSDVGTFYVTDTVITNTTPSLDGEKVNFYLSIINTSNSAVVADVFVATYDTDNKLRDVATYPALPLGTARKSVTIDTKNEYEISEIKIMVWQKGSVVPLRKSISITTGGN